MKSFLIFLTVAVCGFTARAQTADDSIKAAVNQLFTAMRNADTVLLKDCFADSAVLQTIGRDKAGNPVVNNEKVAAFIRSVGSLPKGAADERIVFDDIKTDGPLAMAWTPYQFYFNGKFSHCGVNSFQLVRQRGIWKIQYIIDTRRRTNCK